MNIFRLWSSHPLINHDYFYYLLFSLSFFFSSNFNWKTWQGFYWIWNNYGFLIIYTFIYIICCFFLFSFYLPSNHTINLLLCMYYYCYHCIYDGIHCDIRTYSHTHIGRTIAIQSESKRFSRCLCRRRHFASSCETKSNKIKTMVWHNETNQMTKHEHKKKPANEMKLWAARTVSPKGSCLR